MLCNTDILINVTPIFIRAFADPLFLINFICFDCFALNALY